MSQHSHAKWRAYFKPSFLATTWMILLFSALAQDIISQGWKWLVSPTSLLAAGVVLLLLQILDRLEKISSLIYDVTSITDAILTDPEDTDSGPFLSRGDVIRLRKRLGLSE